MTRLLLDTHAFVWWLTDAPLKSEAHAAIADPNNQVFVSAASVWEITIKRALGKIEFPGSITATIRTAGFDALAISCEHVEQVGELPSHHRDPFDRLLIAQAQFERFSLVSRDNVFGQYDVRVLAC